MSSSEYWQARIRDFLAELEQTLMGIVDDMFDDAYDMGYDTGHDEGYHEAKAEEETE